MQAPLLTVTCVMPDPLFSSISIIIGITTAMSSGNTAFRLTSGLYWQQPERDAVMVRGDDPQRISRADGVGAGVCDPVVLKEHVVIGAH